MAVALVVAAMAALYSALPQIAVATRATQAQLTWIVDGYTLVLACFVLPAGSAGGPVSTLTPPPAFPEGIALYQQAYQNWSKEIMLDAIWTCSPKTPEDVVRLANWGHANGYTIRPRGAMHGWTPLTIVNGAPVDKVILADTTVHLTGVSVNAGGSPATVTAGPGATLDAITTALQAQGLGFANLPAPGVLTIAGLVSPSVHRERQDDHAVAHQSCEGAQGRGPSHLECSHHRSCPIGRYVGCTAFSPAGR